jgi:hypothetical protein
MNNIKSYITFNEEINLKKPLLGAAISASLLSNPAFNQHKSDKVVQSRIIPQERQKDFINDLKSLVGKELICYSGRFMMEKSYSKIPIDSENEFVRYEPFENWAGSDKDQYLQNVKFKVIDVTINPNKNRDVWKEFINQKLTMTGGNRKKPEVRKPTKSEILQHKDECEYRNPDGIFLKLLKMNTNETIYFSIHDGTYSKLYPYDFPFKILDEKTGDLNYVKFYEKYMRQSHRLISRIKN